MASPGGLSESDVVSSQANNRAMLSVLMCACVKALGQVHNPAAEG